MAYTTLFYSIQVPFDLQARNDAGNHASGEANKASKRRSNAQRLNRASCHPYKLRSARLLTFWTAYNLQNVRGTSCAAAHGEGASTGSLDREELCPKDPGMTYMTEIAVYRSDWQIRKLRVRLL